eukprot:1920178-Rhodomonas_salina.2
MLLSGNYRTTQDYAEHVMPVLCPGGYAAPAIVTSGETATPKPQDLFPDGSAAAGRHASTSRRHSTFHHSHARSDLGVGWDQLPRVLLPGCAAAFRRHVRVSGQVTPRL